jgi:MerR family transcriptional regulator, light-induced transcriptional regulator
MNTAETNKQGLPIAAVERETGLAKDTLRVWERRYSFPQPLRDANGERLYPADQVDRLRQIKRLIDQGMRPGKIFAADTDTFAQWLGNSCMPSQAPEHCQELISLLHAPSSQDLRQALQQHLLRQGLQRFITELVAPLNVEVGLAWMRGEISVGQEHLYTEQIQNLLRSAIHALHSPQGSPRILLSTFPDELHSLGLLMAEAMLVPEGAQCTSLGTQTPLADLAAAALSGEYDIVALSFSPNYPARQAYAGLAELRSRQPAHVMLWAGGRHLCERAPTIEGLRFLAKIEEVIDALEAWRAGPTSAQKQG